MKLLKWIGGIFLLLVVYVAITTGYSIYNGTFGGERFVFEGSSLEEYGFDSSSDPSVDSKHYLYRSKPCEIGDFCAFKCNTDKCRNSYFNSDAFLKKVTEKNGDCYFFMGNENPVTRSDGIKYYSWDSRAYGWLCGNDLIIDGVVK